VSDEFVGHIRGMLAPMGDITVRRMFGGYCLYCDTIPFALIAEGIFYVKADDRNRPAFLDAGVEPFRPFPGKPTALSYYPVPESALDDTGELLAWTRPAFEAGLRAAAKKARSNKKKAAE